MVAIGVGVWGQACLLALGTFSSSLLRMDRDGALCSRGCMISDLGGAISPKHVDTSHHFHLYFNIHSFQW